MYAIQEKWEKRSTIRSRTRIIYDKEASGYLYPISRQPLALHPMFIDKGDTALQYLLVQSFYKYSNDIAAIETRVVNNTILKVINNELPIEFTPEQKLNLYTIMVDEAYHAYVAYDTMLQVESYTGIKALPPPKTIEIERAIAIVKPMLNKKYHGIFELICVCLAENTLTKDLISMTDQEDTHPFFKKIMTDHSTDETRHSGIFYHLLEYIWFSIEDDYKKNIGSVLVEFINQYLDVKVQKEFDKQVLLHLGFIELDANTMLKDVYGGYKLTKQHPMLNNIMNLLNKCNMIDQFTESKFKEIDWI